MAKPILVTLDGVESSFDHSKLDRARLYGNRRRVPLDEQGRPCVKAALTVDGAYLLQSGMTAQGYFDEQGRWLQKSELVGLDADGEVVDLKPSTLGVPQELSAVEPAEVLRFTNSSVYQLEPAAVDAALTSRLEAGEVFRFAFNYTSDYQLETAFLVQNPEGIFCLVADPTLPEWCEPGRLAVVEEADEASDELDFDMF
jgi:hypothetical protein